MHSFFSVIILPSATNNVKKIFKSTYAVFQSKQKERPPKAPTFHGERFSFCGVLLDTQSDFQIVIERICDDVNISILAGVSLTLLVGDDGCVIYDMVYTNIHGQFVVAVFSGTIFENIRTINDRAVGIHTTLMRGVLFADMQNYDVPKLHITSGKKTPYMAGAFYIIEQVH